MINYNSKTSSTNSILLNMILSILLLNSTIDSSHVEKANSHYQSKHNISSSPYSSKSIDETFSINSKYKKIDHNENEILKNLNVFLASLLSEQESLGEEFSKVLFDDIFDLYQS
ncbi:hypothetical protein [Aggregatibacter kilianii]|uniref:hypothetical protein n=1 Tax=Aggregatibacter kilianii TaxID=2025884 RepID=UPI0028D4C65B|nr:hypothetical protein [Aggregatibacter kilianii]